THRTSISECFVNSLRRRHKHAVESNRIRVTHYFPLVYLLTPGDCADDVERLRTRRDCGRQRCVSRLVRHILTTRKEPQQRTTLARNMIANGPTQHRITSLERVEDRASCHFAVNLKLHITTDARQRSQVCRQNYNNHFSVWTSTESTGGRSRTIGAHVSPPSGEPYTCPPVVPKYTPHESSESTAIASRSTFT